MGGHGRRIRGIRQRYDGLIHTRLEPRRHWYCYRRDQARLPRHYFLHRNDVGLRLPLHHD